jgi:hypothetical protein
MAKCDEGYRCEVCGNEVEDIKESGLYLRYVMGEVQAEKLHQKRERHIRCDPTIAQFIVDQEFEPIRVNGPFAKEHLASDYVTEQEDRVTRAWLRLQEIPNLGISLLEYPLPKVIERWNRKTQIK